MIRPMELTYIKIAKNTYKFFYDEDKEYGEFYMDIVPDSELTPIASGKAVLYRKDPDYAKSLMDGFGGALVEYKN